MTSADTGARASALGDQAQGRGPPSPRASGRGPADSSRAPPSALNQARTASHATGPCAVICRHSALGPAPWGTPDGNLRQLARRRGLAAAPTARRAGAHAEGVSRPPPRAEAAPPGTFRAPRVRLHLARAPPLQNPSIRPRPRVPGCAHQRAAQVAARVRTTCAFAAAHHGRQRHHNRTPSIAAVAHRPACVSAATVALQPYATRAAPAVLPLTPGGLPRVSFRLV